MGVLKWLRRERGGPGSTRRHSSTSSEDNALLSRHSAEDPLRTEEYERAMAQFLARRSTDGRFTITQSNTIVTRSREELTETTPQRQSLPESRPYVEHKAEVSIGGLWPQSERKSRWRKSNRQAQVPQIQFLFNNQIFMPGSGSRLTVQAKQTPPPADFDEPEDFASTAPDFDDPVGLADSPPDFFSLKQNSLPIEVASAQQNEHRSYSPPPVAPLLQRLSESQHDLLSGSSDATADDFDSGVSATGGCVADRQLSEIIQELRSLDDWADEQLRINKHSESVNDASFASIQRKFEEMCQRVNGHFRGVPIVKTSAISDHSFKDDTGDAWSPGMWGNSRVYLHRVKRKLAQSNNNCLATEMDILTTLRQPNMLLLMGLCYDHEHSITMIFEDCIGSLHDALHKQGRTITQRMSLCYIRDVTSALLFLNMHGKVHTCVSSHCIMLTQSDVAKLANFAHCHPIPKQSPDEPLTKYTRLLRRTIDFGNEKDNAYEVPVDFLPLISQSESVTSLNGDDDNQQTVKCAEVGIGGEKSLNRGVCFRWQAPELFRTGFQFTEKCDVFSVSLVMWECCNLTIPWFNLDHQRLGDLYLKYGTGINLPEDRNCPESILEILEDGLELDPSKRISLKNLIGKLENAKVKLQNNDICPFKNDALETIQENHQISSSNEENLNSTYTEDLERLAITVRSEGETSPDSFDRCVTYERLERVPIFLKQIDKYEVTDLDDCNDETDRSYPKYSPLKTSSNITPRSEELLALESTTPLSHLQKTDSTEYCSLLSPESKKIFQLPSCTRPHLDSPQDLDSRVSRLNQSLTPKSYRPLHIRMPSVGNFDNFKHLSQNELARKCQSEKKYRFEIRNSVMPETPIARNTKLRKNAWLTGETEDLNDKLICEGNRRHSDVPFAVRQKECREVVDEAKSLLPDEKCASLGSDLRKKTIPMKCRTLFRQFSEDHNDAENEESYGNENGDNSCIGAVKSLSSKSLFKSPFKIETNMDRFRTRSQSWSCRPSTLTSSSGPKQEDEVLLKVNVKPLVAIHERWILEQRQNEGRSRSLPDTQRGFPNLVKPASHCIDTVGRKSMTKRPICMPKGLNKSQNDIDLAERCSELSNELKEVLSRRQQKDKEPDNFEATLWKRERDICMDSMPKIEIQNCSTPFRSVRQSNHEIAQMQIDSSTNTTTYDELYERIKKEVLTALGIVEPDLIENHTILNGIENTEEFVKCISSSIVLDIKERLSAESDKNYHTAADNTLDRSDMKLIAEASHSIGGSSMCVCFDNSSITNNFSNFLSKTAIVQEPNCNCKRDEDAISLPEQFTDNPSDDFSHKTLKRCQAFTALQEARSTEDLYIDDELLEHPDNIQNLGDNMKLIPLHGSLHEALCDKYEDCCLIKIQEETECNHVYIVCDKPSKEDAVEDDSCSGNEISVKRTFSAIAEEPDEELLHEKCNSDDSVHARMTEANKSVHSLQMIGENSLPVIIEECELPSEQIKVTADTQSDKKTDRNIPTLTKGDRAQGNIAHADNPTDTSIFTLRENTYRELSNIFKSPLSRFNNENNILEDLVQTFECTKNDSNSMLDNSDLQALQIVEDFQEFLGTNCPNEGYAELSYADDVEIQNLIDLDDSNSSQANENCTLFCGN